MAQLRGMAMDALFPALGLFLVIALLYASVGHAGASGYLAVMALLSFPPASIKSTSLVLNIVVALVASVKYLRAGCFDRRAFVSVIVSSLPMAYLGGTLSLGPGAFQLAAGAFLVLAALLLPLRGRFRPAEGGTGPMPSLAGLSIGAGIGFVSGIIGVGGGIFLSPIIVLANWSSVRNASGTAAVFILCNSIAGLAGHVSALGDLDPRTPYWVVAVAIGGLLGAELGSKRIGERAIIALLFLVLLTAGSKMLLAGRAA